MITAIKYLFKYVYKGHDRATVEVRNNDEIGLYLDARYISASEASWRIFHYRLHNEKPDVIQLCVHLPGQYRVLFRDDERLEDVIERSNIEKSTLTAWFHANTIFQMQETQHMQIFQFNGFIIIKPKIGNQDNEKILFVVCILFILQQVNNII